jgi:hypothetical protein
MPNSYVEAAAAEVRRHLKNKGWALGLAIAACVEPGTSAGNRVAINAVGKESAKAFAKEAHTDEHRVMRFVRAWDRAAKAGVVVPRSQLTPADWDRTDLIPEVAKWGAYYRSRAENPTTTVTRLVHQAAPKKRAEIAKAVVEAEPEAVAEAVVSDTKAHQAVIRASARRSPKAGPMPHADAPEPFERAVVVFGTIVLVGNAEKVAKAVAEFGGTYVWRPGDRESVIADLDRAATLIRDVRDVITGLDPGDLDRLLAG